MLRALSNAASGMKAQEVNIDVISNNLANVNTTGYKKARAEFADLFYEQRVRSGTPSPTGTPLPGGTEIGFGVRTVATYKNFNTGDMRETGNPLDIAIEGKGFLKLIDAEGNEVYTRSGILKTNSDGQIVNVDGYLLDPALSIPQDSTSITISETGVLSVTTGADSIPMEIGRIELVNFANPAGLISMGRNLYGESPASGAAMPGNPAEEGYGRILQGFTEGSNVAVVTEMIDMISAQRAYEINSKVIKAADEMLTQTTRLN